MTVRKTLLLVEDETDLVNIARMSLESDFDIFSAKRWPDAEQLLERIQPDLCVLDMSPCVRQEFDRITEMLKTRGIPFLIHTGDDGIELSGGAVAIVRKPHLLSVPLLRTIEESDDPLVITARARKQKV